VYDGVPSPSPPETSVTQNDLNDRRESARELVRPAWVLDFVAGCHRLVGHAIHPALATQSLVLNDFVRALPDPLTAAEDAFARGLLLSAAVRWGNRVHSVVHLRKPPAPCRFDPSALLDTLVRTDHRSSKALFSDWAERFVVAFEAAHRLTPVFRAAAIVDRRFVDPPDLRQLARQVETHPHLLDRGFRETFGMSVHEYVTRVRIAHALPMLREADSNIDSVARLVGYRSTKNFYRAVRRLTGRTPSELRALPAAQASHLAATIVGDGHLDC
jgi:AraC-like DNA-binding protein